MEQKYYVYLLLDPRDQSVFYVGKGAGKRYRVHFTESSLKKVSFKNSVIKAIHYSGLKPSVLILAADLDESAAFDLEKLKIAEYGRRIDGSGTLTNLTGGGEGMPGYTYAKSDEHKRKISAAHTGMRYTPEVNKKKGSPGSSNPMYGKKKTEKHKTAMKEMHSRMRDAGRANFNSKKIRILDDAGKVKYECFGNFSEVCDEHGLPKNALSDSYKNGGKRIYTKYVSKKFSTFAGWSAVLSI